MIALIRQVILCVTAASLFGAVSLSLVSDGALKEVVRIGVGLVLILSLALPLRSLVSLPELDVWPDTDAPQAQTEDLYREAVRQQVQAETAQYVMQQARKQGVACTAQATAEIADDGAVSITAVSIAPDSDVSDERLTALKRQLVSELGVPDSAIVVNEEGIS